MTATYEKIATTTLGSAAATVTFSSIPATYTDLVLICNPISTATSGAYMNMTYNSDTASNYSYTWMRGNGSTAASGRGSNSNYIYIHYSSEVPTTAKSIDIVHILNYSNTTTYKTCITRGNDASSHTESIVGLWRSTSAINTITIDFDSAGSTIASGSSFTLYGIKAE